MALLDDNEEVAGRPVHLVDCTLREGDQTPGVWMTVEEKLELLELIAACGVPLVDAGMPEIGEDEQRFLRQATGRTAARVGASIRLRISAVQEAVNSGCDELFLICPASPLHRKARLGLELDALRQRLAWVTRAAWATGRIVNLVAEDAARTPLEELVELCAVALDAGASRLFLCDTVGVLTPAGMADLVRVIHEVLGEGVPVGVHCHNDFGMATANTIAALEAGADWPTACVNGIGERSGNASLAEVALAAEHLLVRPTGIDARRLPALAACVERITGLVIPPHQPIVGHNAYRHESGIHVDGMLKHQATYEPIPPERVGRTTQLVLGKHSGRAYFRYVASRHGLSLSEAVLERTLALLRARGPGRARAAFQVARDALTVWEQQGLGGSEDDAIALIRRAQALEGTEPDQRIGAGGKHSSRS